jgi:hypothetical protein
MAKLTVKEIHQEALNIIAARSGGIRYTELRRAIQERRPETPLSTIGACVWDLDKIFPDKVSKPSRGLFQPAGIRDVVPLEPTISAGKMREQDFYEPFAEWLKKELDEATMAVSIGGAASRKSVLRQM